MNDEFGTFYKIKLFYKNTIVIPNYRIVEYHLSKKNNRFYYYKFDNNKLVYMSNEFRCNHMIKNIYHIMENIKKLNDGKVKTYHIFYQLELEVLCDYLKKNNILHRIKIECYKSYKKYLFYDEYNLIDKGMYFNYTDSNYEKNKIINNFRLYIEVYKGFTNLFNKTEIEKPKFGIYLYPESKRINVI